MCLISSLTSYRLRSWTSWAISMLEAIDRRRFMMNRARRCYMPSSMIVHTGWKPCGSSKWELFTSNHPCLLRTTRHGPNGTRDIGTSAWKLLKLSPVLPASTIKQQIAYRNVRLRSYAKAACLAKLPACRRVYRCIELPLLANAGTSTWRQQVM